MAGFEGEHELTRDAVDDVEAMVAAAEACRADAIRLWRDALRPTGGGHRGSVCGVQPGTGEDECSVKRGAPESVSSRHTAPRGLPPGQ